MRYIHVAVTSTVAYEIACFIFLILLIEWNNILNAYLCWFKPWSLKPSPEKDAFHHSWKMIMGGMESPPDDTQTALRMFCGHMDGAEKHFYYLKEEVPSSPSASVPTRILTGILVN